MKKHEWRQDMPDGDVRIVTALYKGGRWHFQCRLKSERESTKLDALDLEDLQQLREILWNKSQRRRVPLERVYEIDAMIKDAEAGP